MTSEARWNIGANRLSFKGVRINGPSVALDGEALSGMTVSQRR